MSDSETGEQLISEVTLAINNERKPQTCGNRSLNSSGSDTSDLSQLYNAQPFDFNKCSRRNSEIDTTIPKFEDLRIPIVGYEIMEERARFTVYKLRVEYKNGESWFIFRRYTDFVRLITQMRRQKLSISHLSLPRKKWIGDNFAPNFLEERIKGLQKFVDTILSTAILVENASVREFFCLDKPPALSDTAEEARAIFEALEDTIYHLRQQLYERDIALAAETSVCNELRSKIHQLITDKKICPKCGEFVDIADVYN